MELDTLVAVIFWAVLLAIGFAATYGGDNG